MAGVLFEDIFDVKDIDPEGKKFDRGKVHLSFTFFISMCSFGWMIPNSWFAMCTDKIFSLNPFYFETAKQYPFVEVNMKVRLDP